MKLTKKQRIAVGAGLVLVVGVIVAYSVIRDNNSKVAVKTGKVSRRDLVSTITASGEIKPRRYVDISANVPGRITELAVKEGHVVRKGQVLARIESTRFEAVARQSRAGVLAQRSELDRAVAELNLSTLSFGRRKKMYGERLISEQEFEQAEADVKIKRAAVEALRRRVMQQEASFESSRDELEKTTVVSPMDGVVTNLRKEEGEVVIGAQSFSPTVIMTVADLSVMEVELLVDETDIRNVELGQEAEVRVDALEDLKIKGEVTEIGASALPRGAAGASASGGQANTSNQAKDFKVVVTLKDPPNTLRSGLNATADIVTARRSHVPAVPLQAVVVREVNSEGKVVDPNDLQTTPADSARAGRKAEEQEGVFLVKGGVVAFAPVKTGVIGETDIEILEGLSEGQEIVVGSYKVLRTLKDGARIKPEGQKRWWW